jgi:hypothetical protein
MEQIWVLSNRQDDRVVLWERDPAHPGGEAFVASGAPAKVAKTGEVARLLREGFLVEVPEPKDGPKKPHIVEAVNPAPAPAMPGQVVRLGRKLDEALFDQGEIERVEKAQEKLPDEAPVPAGVVVPPEPEPERTRNRR